MRLVLTIQKDTVLIGKYPLPEELVPYVALHSRVIDKSQPGKLVVDFTANLQTPGIHKLPLVLLKQLYH